MAEETKPRKWLEAVGGVLFLAAVAVGLYFAWPWLKEQFASTPKDETVAAFRMEYKHYSPGPLGVHLRERERSEYLFRYTGTNKLEDIDLTITLYPESGARPEIKRFWAKWDPDEMKTVESDIDFTRMEKLELTGTAKMGGKDVKLRGSFLRHEGKDLLKEK